MSIAQVEAVRKAALEAHKAGLSVVPPREDGSKAPLGEWKAYQRERPTLPQLQIWYEPGRTGLGIVTGVVSQNLEVLDFDAGGEAYADFRALAIASGLEGVLERIEAGYKSRTPSRGVHLAYFCRGIGGNTKLARRAKRPEERKNPQDKIQVLIESRGEGGYSIEPPSNGKVHPTGQPYVQESGNFATIATITPEEREELWRVARSLDQMPLEDRRPLEPRATVSEGRPGDDFNGRGDWGEILGRHGWTPVYSRGETTFWRRPGKGMGVSATTGFGGDWLYCFSTSTAFESEQVYNKFAAYAVLNHGGDFQAAARELAGQGFGSAQASAPQPGERGGQPIPEASDSAPWPSPLEGDAFHGLAGDVVAAIRPHTEADDAALLINFLVAFGNNVGRGPHAIAEADRHGCNLSAVLVGETAKGRKGSSWGHIRELFWRADPTWTGDHVAEGLSSGEGLIWAVRDPIERMAPVKEKGRHTGEYETIVEDQGVADKRLLVLEGEFAGVLKVMAREGSTLSPALRSAWDKGALRTLTKNSPARATGAHISIVGHITRGELLRYLNDTEAGNGFANRFLWGCTRRARVLPHGGGLPNYDPLVERLHTTLERGRKIERLERDGLARQLWAEVYPELSEGKPGLFGAVTARAEAQVLRLSLVYAVLDSADAIGAEHLKAALAVWEYCEASARYIFGDATGDPVADQILRALRMAGELTRTAISSLFNRNVAAARIEHALKTLVAAGLARCAIRPPSEEGGRPAEVWLG